MITVSNITKQFGTLKAVDDVSFSIAKGEIVGLLGPNGAGKTTTMRIMTGYYEPDAGDVKIGGVSVSSDPIETRRQIGYLAESNPLYREMLVSEFLTFVARSYGVLRSALRTSFDRVVADTGIDAVFYRPIGELSKGYRQRVGLAATLIGDPSVLILDEPTEGLDPNQRSDLRNLLARLAKEKTLLVSTHVISEIQAIAHKVIVLHQGRIAAIGDVRDLTMGGSTRYTLDVEGKDVRKLVFSLPSVSDAHSEEHGKGREIIRVTVTDSTTFPRDMSKLIATHHLIVHKLVPETDGLERVFAELTTARDRADTASASHGA